MTDPRWRPRWEAITDPAQTSRYYCGTAVHSDWRPGSRLEYTYPDGSVAADGLILEVDAGRRVVMEFNALWDDAIREEPPVRMTWEITPVGEVCRLVVTTEDLVPGSATQQSFEGGIAVIVSGLKTLLETGAPLPMGAGAG